ncbi:alpha/beta hydrolase-fold protein [Aquimarina gracilis]|uniref:Alpha/beta hydrolase-fold protein n=1 Tax=Aquimarina gracilis TaxID=874422 RepID=A0ABU6A1E1_9FLAO|nr:alpha/beta hydrolase-fold protein [Aquimarina gracilis]MEB3347980.1 alpha/beta hydrolase-fold protein [Aquimarina gracilis]
MKTIKLLILTIVLSLNTIFAQKSGVNVDTKNTEISYLELPRIQVIPIKDTKNKRQYELYIKLPEGYSKDNDTKYPVIYFTDAMWHVEILSGSAEYIIQEAILVGISWQKDLNSDSVYTSRFRDYSITKSSNPEHQAKYQFGGANDHLAFIQNDVIPYVENNYHTDPDNRSYFGYSMGRKFGAYILFTQPDTFKNYILGSPSVSSNKPYIHELESIKNLNRKNLNANIFVSVGALERKDAVGQAIGLASILRSENYTTLSSKLEVIESADHSKAFPMTAVLGMYWLSDFIKK